MRGYRNVAITFGYIGLCAWYGWLAGPEHLGDLTGPLSGIGVAIVGIIAGRAANKYVESKGEPPCGST